MNSEEPKPIGRISDVAVTKDGFVTVDGSVVASGGWCAPSDTVYDVATLRKNEFTATSIEVPTVTGIWPGTPEWEEHQLKIQVQRDAEREIRRLVDRVIGNVVSHQQYAIERAYYDAEFYGLDLHVWRPPRGHSTWRWDRGGDLAPYRFIGLSLEERPPVAPRGIRHPIVYEHQVELWDPYDEDY